MFKKAGDKLPGSIWKNQSVIALTHVECLVLTANDFGDIITQVSGIQEVHASGLG